MDCSLVRMDSTKTWDSEILNRSGTGVVLDLDDSTRTLVKCSLNNPDASRWLVMEVLNADETVKSTYAADPGQNYVKTLSAGEQAGYTVREVSRGDGSTKYMVSVPHRVYRAHESPILPLTGLDWDGNPSGRRAIVFTTGLPASHYPMTYLWKVYPRQQVSGVGDGSRYYTTFFYGNNGVFDWNGTWHYSYYGCHPFPYPTNTGNAKWEIAFGGGDFLGRGDDNSVSDNAGAPFVTNDRWYSQAFVATYSGGTFDHKAYIDLPSVAAADYIRTTWPANAPVVPPSPCIIWGQAPDNGAGVSWGGYTRWEELNGRIRGVQIYSAALSEAHILALAALEYDAEVLAYCSANNITSLWYLNMNWTVGDITDKSGAGHDPSWAGAARPADHVL